MTMNVLKLMDALKAMVSKPKKRALLIGYVHEDMKIQIAALADRYRREGYEVKELFIIEKQAENALKTDAIHRDLARKIKWAKAGKSSVLQLRHHGLDPEDPDMPETPWLLKGATTAALLLKHGLNDSDLKKMKIRNGTCFGALKEAKEFYETLHSGGAGYFEGDAKYDINGVRLKEKASEANIDELINEYVATLVDIEEEIIDFSKNPPTLKATGDQATREELELHVDTTQKLAYTIASKRFLETRLQRGDSFSEMKRLDSKGTLEASKLPLEQDPTTNEYLCTQFYLAPKRKPNSRIEITSNPERVAAFKSAKKRIFKRKSGSQKLKK